MGEGQLISISEFCSIHEVEISFIDSLEQSGLISLIKVDNTDFIDSEQLMQLEKFVMLYYELEINIEGIETIDHLLRRIKTMQEEVLILSNRLKFYESDE
jgi:chaperone modulatory protein CbpM